MTKSKKAFLRIISLACMLLALTFVTLLLIFHLAFPIKYSKIISAAAKKYELDESLIRAVIWTESKYDKDAVSKKGASGLMQLMPSTAEYLAARMGLDFEEEMLYDEQINIDLGCYYLRYLFDKFKQEEMALAAYNAGEGNVQKWQEQHLDEIPYKETRDYIKRVTTVKKIYSFKSK